FQRASLPSGHNSAQDVVLTPVGTVENLAERRAGGHSGAGRAWFSPKTSLSVSHTPGRIPLSDT
ncbi:MAG: hypothetical protein ACRDQZ_23720, partial [Mycobacteriales bacterium]